jgi:tetratricopeptide (TPR) repeat protein
METRSSHIGSRYVERRVLLLSGLLLGALFAVTAALARSYHAREQDLAAEWFRRGNAELAAGRPAQAFEDFRTSLAYGPDSRDVQLKLAEALLADGRYNETRTYLENLWEQAPGSGQVNLDLAHVAMKTGDVDDAIRYFHGAILGSWEKEPATARRKVRFELCDFLLARGQVDDARSEIAGLAVDTPGDDGPLREQNGRLFLKVGEPARALTEFEAALRTNPRQPEWLAEAGRVAFDDGDYFKAESYLSKAARENPSAENKAALELVHDVLGDDPFLDGLNAAEQARRSLSDFKQSLDRLDGCAQVAPKDAASGSEPSDLDALEKEGRELQRRATVTALTRSSEMRADVMNFVSRAENASSLLCGPGSSADQALEIIEKRHEVGNQ